MTPWEQVYNPLNNVALSTMAAAIPPAVLLGALAILRMRAYWAAVMGLIFALGVAIFVFKGPPTIAFSAAMPGALFGLLPVGWIILHVIFLYRLTKEKGDFEVLQKSLTGITQDLVDDPFWVGVGVCRISRHGRSAAGVSACFDGHAAGARASLHRVGSVLAPGRASRSTHTPFDVYAEQDPRAERCFYPKALRWFPL
jgi:hypothetical protein